MHTVTEFNESPAHDGYGFGQRRTICLVLETPHRSQESGKQSDRLMRKALYTLMLASQAMEVGEEASADDSWASNGRLS